MFVKYGMLSEDKFYDKAKDFAILTNTKKENYTLTEYREKVEAIQTDKDATVVYLYATEPAKQDGFIQSAERKGYDVLLMDSPIDPHFISKLEQKLEKTSLKRVDADVADKLIDKDEKISLVLSDEDKEKVKGIFEKAITNSNMKVEVDGLSPDQLPVTVTMDEFMRRMKDMARMGGGGGMNFYGSLPDRYNVAINGNHKLIDKILKADEAHQVQLAKQAYDLAMLSQGMLTGADLTEFVARSLEMI